MGQKTNPIGNRLGIIKDGILTGLAETIMETESRKTTKSEDTLKLDYLKVGFQEFILKEH
jgi:hypothetical protein